MTKAGFKTGDVILLVANNTPTACFPIYVSLLNGMPLLPLGDTSKYEDIEHAVRTCEPKIVFCVKNNVNTIRDVFRNNNLDATIIVMDLDQFDIEAFIAKQGFLSVLEVKQFKPTNFPKNTPACLIASSGTTAKPKFIVHSQGNICSKLQLDSLTLDFVSTVESFFVLSSPQWITTMILYYYSATYGFTRLQTSVPLSIDLFRNVFQNYKPQGLMSAPTITLQMIHTKCDLSCLKLLWIGGSASIPKLEMDMKQYFPGVSFASAYGMTEVGGVLLAPQSKGPMLNVGKEFEFGYKYRLVDTSTGKEIMEPNVTGEMWIKGDTLFQEYYDNLKETIKSFSEDGYFKTGDLMYRDGNGYYFFVGRLKALIRYNLFNVFPWEIEDVLMSHAAVEKAVAVGINDNERGELPLAFVKLKQGHKVSAKELIERVANNLSDQNQLRGGVMFLDNFPMTHSGKVNLFMLRQLIENSSDKIQY